MDGANSLVIQLPADLLDRAAARARQTGAASLDDYVAALIEHDTSSAASTEGSRDNALAAAAARREELLERMRSLGYVAAPPAAALRRK